LERPVTEAGILSILYLDLIKKIDQEAFNKLESTKKGFTVASKTVEGKRLGEITYHSETSMIHGILEGGKYGRKRVLREVENKNQGSSIEPKHLVGDRFYFLLYTPLDEHTLILLIQGYTEVRISDAITRFLRGYLKVHSMYSCEIEPFIPRRLKDQYINGATFKSLIFTSDWNIQGNFDDDITEKEYQLEVQIVIKDKSQEKARHKYYTGFLQQLGQSVFKLAGLDGRTLEDFGSKRAKMESRGKEFPIHFDNENEIRPTILLTNEGIPVDDGLVPDFDAVDQYCKALLEEIKDELNPANAVDRL